MLIENKVPGVYAVGDVRFMPGVNSVADHDWETIKLHPHVAYKLEADELVVVGEGNRSLDGTTETLAAFKPKESRKLVESTFDVELLNKWADTEKRADVARAIKVQLKKILGQASKDETTEVTGE